MFDQLASAYLTAVLYALTGALLVATLIIFAFQLRTRKVPAALEASPERLRDAHLRPLFHAPYPFEPLPPPRPRAPQIIALNLGDLKAMAEDGKTYPIVSMFDFEGDETPDPDEALAVVVALPNGYCSLPVADYCWPRPVH